MKNRISALIVLFLSLTVYAEIPAGYYDTATDSGYILKTQLHNIIDDHNDVSYTPGVWDAFVDIEKDLYYENDGSPLDVYSEDPNSIDPYNWTFVSSQCGTYSGEGSCYNREHSFPKSWFNDGYPMYTDIHHLYLTDGYVNGMRSNWPFGEVGSATWTSQNGSKVGSCSYPGYTGTVFEPIDEFKGDFARTYFYMATRYEDVLTSWSSAVLDGSTDQVYTQWHLDMLIEWHTNDPVSQKEIDRNDGVYGVQNNRNPFIDHPEYVAIVWEGAMPVPSINFITTSQTVEENSGANSITVSISEAITDDVTANFTVTGNATNIDDYTISQSNVFFPASSTGNQSVTLTIVDDVTPEDFETIILTIDNLVTVNSEIVIGGSNEITITINNNDGFDETPPTVDTQEVLNDSTVILTYSEVVEPVTSQLVTNYVVDNAIGNPDTAALGYLGDSTKVVLSFPAALQPNTYQITINNVEDIKGNPIATNTTVVFGISSGPGDGWIEYFELADWGSYTTGTETLETGDWDLVDVYPETSASVAYEGDHAVRMNDDSANSSITSPAVNGADSVIFYYRALNSEGSASTFWLQKSVDGGAYENVTSGSFQNTTYSQFAYKVNDASDNIRLRIESDQQSGHLIVDYFKVVTFSGPVQDTTPPVISSHVVTDSTLIITFSEDLDPITSQTLTNYVLDNGVGNPSAAVLGYGSDSTIVEIFFPTFQLDVNYQLTINNVEDPSGNPMTIDYIDFIINSGGGGGGDGWIEDFELADWGSYSTGTYTLTTGDWDILEVYPETSATTSYEGTHAVRLNDSPDDSNITTPAINGVDSVIFYYRALNGGDPLSEFYLQKSVDGGAFTNVTSQTFSGSVFTEFAYKVNDLSDNIKLRVVNDGSEAHLIMDNFEVVNFAIANDPDAPTNVSTLISGGNITISWDAVTGATSYDVYSSDLPYSGYSLETNVATNEYTIATTAAKKFYYIVSKDAKK